MVMFLWNITEQVIEYALNISILVSITVGFVIVTLGMLGFIFDVFIRRKK
jgi:hypothetical protein